MRSKYGSNPYSSVNVIRERPIYYAKDWWKKRVLGLEWKIDFHLIDVTQQTDKRQTDILRHCQSPCSEFMPPSSCDNGLGPVPSPATSV